MDELIEMIDMLGNSMTECFKTKGVKGIDTQEMSFVADIYKDLCMSLYYHTVIKAMHESSPEEIKNMVGKTI